jgi:glycosyltransferase involved in cell wall biosynthesis
MANNEEKAGPVVSVLIPTFNRPRYLSEALASALRQTYTNLEIFVIRDGGEQVSDIVSSFNDPRIVFIDRAENRGLAFTLNEALVRAQGKYICYLGDDDLYYPNHIETLVSALENQTDCQVAYSDFYKVCCKVSQDGTRQVLSKVLEISRDFDRFFMLYFNHVLHVCLMHRQDLLEKTGPYNEKLNVLIDWDITRRLVFFSDFYHVPQITGEYYNPIGKSDRISVLRREDESEYLRNVLTIRTTRPPKPWSKIEDTSIIIDADRLDGQAGKTIGAIWRYTFFPYKLYLPLPRADVSRLDTDMPNIVLVPVNPLFSHIQRVDAALEMCDGEYVGIVPVGFPVKDFWIENSLYALINGSALSSLPKGGSDGREGFELEGSTDAVWAVVLRKADLQYARNSFPHLPLRQSLEAAGIVIRRPNSEEIPFRFDNLLQQAQSATKNGSFAEAAWIFEYIADHHQNRLWMKALAAKAFFQAGDHTRAAQLTSEVNQQRPTVDTLLLEAILNRKKKKFNPAIELLKKAEQMLEGTELLWT